MGANSSPPCHGRKCITNFFLLRLFWMHVLMLLCPEKLKWANITKVEWNYSQFCISEKWICETRLAQHQALVTEAIRTDDFTTFERTPIFSMWLFCMWKFSMFPLARIMWQGAWSVFNPVVCSSARCIIGILVCSLLLQPLCIGCYLLCKNPHKLLFT